MDSFKQENVWSDNFMCLMNFESMHSVTDACCAKAMAPELAKVLGCRDIESVNAFARCYASENFLSSTDISGTPCNLLPFTSLGIKLYVFPSELFKYNYSYYTLQTYERTYEQDFSLSGKKATGRLIRVPEYVLVIFDSGGGTLFFTV